MKKLFTILCAATLTLSLSAQTQFGLIAGLNMAHIFGESVEHTDSRLGIRLGVSAAIPLSDAMTYKTGVLYSVKGYSLNLTENFDGQIYETNVNQSLNYLEIPMNLSFAVSDQLFLMAGPYIGIFMGTTAIIDGEDIDVDTEGLRSKDIGVNVGAGFEISEAISVNAGYQKGLTPLEKSDISSKKNINFHIGMTFSFGG